MKLCVVFKLFKETLKLQFYQLFKQEKSWSIHGHRAWCDKSKHRLGELNLIWTINDSSRARLGRFSNNLTKIWLIIHCTTVVECKGVKPICENHLLRCIVGYVPVIVYCDFVNPTAIHYEFLSCVVVWVMSVNDCWHLFVI